MTCKNPNAAVMVFPTVLAVLGHCAAVTHHD